MKREMLVAFLGLIVLPLVAALISSCRCVGVACIKSDAGVQCLVGIDKVAGREDSDIDITICPQASSHELDLSSIQRVYYRHGRKR